MPSRNVSGRAGGFRKRAAPALAAVNRALGAALHVAGLALAPLLWALRAAPKAFDALVFVVGAVLRTLSRGARPFAQAAEPLPGLFARALSPLAGIARPVLRPAVYAIGGAAIIYAVSPWRDFSSAAVTGPEADLLQARSVSENNRTALVFPTEQGRRWSMLASAGDSRFVIDTVVLGRRTVANRQAYVFETRQSGRRVQQKAYLVSRSGVDRLAIGRRAQTIIDPPMPMLRYPVHVGDAVQWRGRLVAPSGITQARSVCKVCCIDSLDTPAGTKVAYRVRMLVTGRSGAREMRYASRVWLAPGVGIVREEFPYNGLTATSELLHTSRG